MSAVEKRPRPAPGTVSEYTERLAICGGCGYLIDDTGLCCDGCAYDGNPRPLEACIDAVYKVRREFIGDEAHA